MLNNSKMKNNSNTYFDWLHFRSVALLLAVFFRGRGGLSVNVCLHLSPQDVTVICDFSSGLRRWAEPEFPTAPPLPAGSGSSAQAESAHRVV